MDSSSPINPKNDLLKLMNENPEVTWPDTAHQAVELLQYTLSGISPFHQLIIENDLTQHAKRFPWYRHGVRGYIEQAQDSSEQTSSELFELASINQMFDSDPDQISWVMNGQQICTYLANKQTLNVLSDRALSDSIHAKVIVASLLKYIWTIEHSKEFIVMLLTQCAGTQRTQSYWSLPPAIADTIVDAIVSNHEEFFMLLDPDQWEEWAVPEVIELYHRKYWGRG